MKKFISIFLLISILFTNLSFTVSASTTSSFKDVPASHWAVEYIEDMVQRQVLSGYPNGCFYPENTITRAEFAKIMCLAAGLQVTAVSSSSYKDISASDWFAPYVECGKYYLSGYVINGQKYYRPNDMALREDITVALVKLKGYDTSVYDESILKAMFTDWQSISTDARKYVAVAVEQGLITGFTDNTFRGQATLTRAEASTILYRAYKFGNNNKVFEDAEAEKEVIEQPKEPVQQEKPEEPKEPVQQEKPEEPVQPEKEALKLSMEISKTSYTVEANESLEITVNVSHNIEGDYTPEVTGNAEIISSSAVNTSDMVSKNTYKTKNLEPGKYKLTFSIKDDTKTHTKTVNITVNEPEPEYAYELRTLQENVEKDSSVLYAMVATENSALYLTHSLQRGSEGGWDHVANGSELVVEIKKDSSPKTILSSQNIEYLGEKEMSKEDEARFRNYILALGYNKYDKCPYVILRQFAGNCGTNYYLYNLYTEEFTDIGEPENNYAYIGKDNSGDRVFAITSDNKILSKYGFSSNNSLSHSNANGWDIVPAILDNTPFIGAYKYDNRSGKWGMLDYYVPGSYTYLTTNNHYIYFADKTAKIIYIVDINGDYEILCTFNDIDNIDGKPINMESMDNVFPLTAVDDNGTIYYFDSAYNCIRQLSKVK